MLSLLVVFYVFLFVEVDYELSSYQVPAELSLARQLSLAQQRNAVRCRALPCLTVRCCAVRCGAMRCCAVLCRAACYAVLALLYMPSIIRGIIHTRYLYTEFVAIDS